MKAYQDRAIANVQAQHEAQRHSADQAARPVVDETDPRVRLSAALGKLECADAARRLGQYAEAARLEAEARTIAKGV